MTKDPIKDTENAGRAQESDSAALITQNAVDTVNAVGEGVISFRLDGTITAVNPAVESLTGLHRENLVGNNLRSILPQLLEGLDLERGLAAIDEVAQGRLPKIEHVVLRRDTESPVSISPSVTFITSPAGTPVSAVLTLKDVTERVRARQEQKETDQKYRELVENTNSIIIRITPDHRILFFNEYAQSFFGYSAEEVLGKSVLGTIVPPVDSEGRDLRKMTRKIAAQPEVHGSNDNENICKDGRRVWVHWSNRALRGEQGAVREILCVGTDMTKQRQLARQAVVYRQRLQRLADRLTASEERSRRRLATYIHDTVVQTLSLSNIRLGGVMAALEKAGMPEERERVAGIRELLNQGTKECRGLMEELIPSLLYEVGLHAAIKDFAQKQGQSGGSRITVEGNVRAPLDDALRGLLFQAAHELTMNALKHAGRCEIRIVLSSSDDQVQIQVSDTGRGFDPAALLGAEGNHAEGGFGLFNIRERLVGMGGHLDLASAPGKGTTATVRVPTSAGHPPST